MINRYPQSTIPRATALTDLVLSDAQTPERIDPAIRRVLASRLVALAPPRNAGSVRLDSYSVERARHGDPSDSTPFTWNPRATKRILGLAGTQRVVSGCNATPTSAVRAEIANVIARANEHSVRPGALGTWLAEAPFGVLGSVVAEAVTYSTELLTALEWGRLSDAARVGQADPVWAVPGAPWVSLRGRRDCSISLDAELGTRALLVLRSGRPSRSSNDDLSHVALVEGLTHPDQPLPTRIVGLWPATGKAISIEVTRETTQHAARAVVEAMAKLQRLPSEQHAA